MAADWVDGPPTTQMLVDRRGPSTRRNLQRGCAAAAVSQPSCDCAQVDPGGEQLGRAVVPDRVEVGADAESADHARVAVGDAARAARAGMVGLVGEEELSLVELGAEVGAAGDHLLAVVDQQRDGGGVERDRRLW